MFFKKVKIIFKKKTYREDENWIVFRNARQFILQTNEFKKYQHDA
jgi:hypothetical protein